MATTRKATSATLRRSDSERARRAQAHLNELAAMAEAKARALELCNTPDQDAPRLRRWAAETRAIAPLLGPSASDTAHLRRVRTVVQCAAVATAQAHGVPDFYSAAARLLSGLPGFENTNQHSLKTLAKRNGALVDYLAGRAGDATLPPRDMAAIKFALELRLFNTWPSEAMCALIPWPSR